MIDLSKHKRLILVTGSPRSGTTWLGKIFDSHPGIFYRNEPESEVALKGVAKIAIKQNEENDRKVILDYVPKLAEMRSANVTGTLPMFRKQVETALTFHRRKYSFMANRFLNKVWDSWQIPKRFTDEELNVLRICWKSVQATGRIPTFLHALPEASVVMILRHPCGFLASRIRGQSHGFKPLRVQQWRLQGVEQLLYTSASEGINLTIDAARKLNDVDLSVVHWALMNAKAIQDLESRENCATIRYESLCEDPTGVMRTTFRVVGLPWDPQTEQFLEQSTTQHSSRYYSVFKNPEKSANRWKSELSKDLQYRVAELVADSLPGRLFYHGRATPNHSMDDANSNQE